MITIKSEREIAKMRLASRIVAEVLREMDAWVRPGVSTAELDRLAEDWIRRQGGEPAFKGYRGFPASICASVNEEVVHGIPGERRLKEGDLFTADVGVRLQNYYGDAARTYPVGKISSRARDLSETTRKALEAGIDAMRPGGKLSEVARAIQDTAKKKGYAVVRKFVGHGIGTALHEDPQVPNFVSPDLLANDIILEPGMVLAIEPMFTHGTHDVEILSDGWTVVTTDRKLSAHWEDTVAVTKDGREVLTVCKE